MSSITLRALGAHYADEAARARDGVRVLRCGIDTGERDERGEPLPIPQGAPQRDIGLSFVDARVALYLDGVQVERVEFCGWSARYPWAVFLAEEPGWAPVTLDTVLEVSAPA